MVQLMRLEGKGFAVVTFGWQPTIAAWQKFEDSAIAPVVDYPMALLVVKRFEAEPHAFLSNWIGTHQLDITAMRSSQLAGDAQAQPLS